jgi:hypothetical protein
MYKPAVTGVSPLAIGDIAPSGATSASAGTQAFPVRAIYVAAIPGWVVISDLNNTTKNAVTGTTITATTYLSGTNIYSSGSISGQEAVIGSPGGGNEGAGTINVATGYYLSGILFYPNAVIGLNQSVSMSQSSPISSATIKVSGQLFVANGLSAGAATTLLTAYSQTVNVSTTGAGGMDTGSPPNNGFLAIYAIYAPSSSTASILACNNATCLGSRVYPGSSMPAGGYSQSALIAIVPTDSVGDIAAGGIYSPGGVRKFDYKSCPVMFSGTTGSATATKQSLSTGSTGLPGVPPSALSAELIMYNAVGSGVISYTVASDAAGTGSWNESSSLSGSSSLVNTCISLLSGNAWNTTEIPLFTSQTVWWSDQQTKANSAMFVRSYTY